jgi:hypothetical protein
MMTELSKPLWWIISPLQKLQFAWRFNVTLCISVAALLALALFSLKWSPFASAKIPKTIAVGLIAIWLPAMGYEAWKMFPQTNPDPITTASKKKQIEESRDAPEYRPRWNQSIGQLDWYASLDIDNWDSLLEHEFDAVLQRVNSSNRPPDAKIVQGSGLVTVTARKPREINLQVETPTGALLDAPQFYYPYWVADVLGEATSIPISPSTPDGLINLRVPPGSYRVRLRLARGGAEVAGGIVSLVSVAAMILVVGVSYVRGARVAYTAKVKTDMKHWKIQVGQNGKD